MNMIEYAGHKRILAHPMNRQDYCTYRGWVLPTDENGSDQGYLVEYLDSPNSNHPNHAYYISWSPADVFLAAYRPDGALTFGDALAAMKRGAAVARQGWNGKGMWIAITPGSAFEARHAKYGHAAAKRAVELADGEAEIELLPHIDMRAADGSMVIGWLASQTDMLAEDWHVVEFGG